MADRRPFNVSLSKTKLSVPQKTKQQQKTDSLFLLFSRTRKGPEAKVQTARTGIRDHQRLIGFQPVLSFITKACLEPRGTPFSVPTSSPAPHPSTPGCTHHPPRK